MKKSIMKFILFLLRNRKHDKPARVQKCNLTEQVNRFLQNSYLFRYNLLTDETEYRPANAADKTFVTIGKRELNTLCLEAHARGILCWDKDISRFLFSKHVPEYHPFLLYFEQLPVWDGIDRITRLAQRISSESYWINGFHTWMLGLTAQWTGQTGKHANSVAPLLVSIRQGCLKSTFCKSLMPDSLSRYYSDEVELTSRSNATRKMSEMGLLNLDEFDKYSPGKIPLLKNLMQMADLNLCKAYQKNFRNLPRIASFIGTSNRFDLLSDNTGSRRFLCVEVKDKIDCTCIEHKQIYAQLKTGTFGRSTLLVFGRRRGRAPRAQPHLPAPQSGRRSTTQLFPSCNIRGPKRKNKKSLRCRHLQRTEKAKPCRHEGKQPEQFSAAARARRFSAKARTLWKFLSGSVSDIKK